MLNYLLHCYYVVQLGKMCCFCSLLIQIVYELKAEAYHVLNSVVHYCKITYPFITQGLSTVSVRVNRLTHKNKCCLQICTEVC